MTQKEYHKQWRENNREHLNAYRSQWIKNNPDKNEKYSANTFEWKKNNKERVRAYGQKWRKNHPEQYKAIWHANRSKRKAAEGFFTGDEWKMLKTLFNETCPKCLRSEPDIKLTPDHKIPIFKGGTNYIDNIQPLCEFCNKSKGVKIWFASCTLQLK